MGRGSWTTEAQIDRAVALRATGLRLMDIAAEVNLHPSTVSRLLNDHVYRDARSRHADRVAQWKAPRETPLPGGVPLAEVMATMVADPVMAPHLAEARKPPDLRRESSGVAKLCAQLVDVIDDGETITITASRFGTVIVLRGVVVERPL